MNKFRTPGGLRPTLMRCTLGAAVVLACAPLAAAQSSAHQTWLRMLSRDDANRNGRIERSEYGGSARSFARFDADEDGSLSEDELGVRLATPVLSTRSTTTRRAARVQERRADEMDTLKLRQAALLFFQLDDEDDDTRTLDRDEFRRAFWAYDTDGNAEVALPELVDGPAGVTRRLTTESVEAFATMLLGALDADDSTRVDEIEALDWFDRVMTGVLGDTVSIATLDRDRSAIARGAFEEISTRRSEPLPPAEYDPAPIGRRPVATAAAADAPLRPTPEPARERVAVAKETDRTVPAPIGRGDVPSPASARAPAPARAETPDVGRRTPVVASAPAPRPANERGPDAATREPARVGVRTPTAQTADRGRDDAAPARGTPVTRRDAAPTTEREPAQAEPAERPSRAGARSSSSSKPDDTARTEAGGEAERDRKPADAEPRATKVTTSTRGASEPATKRGTSTRATSSADRDEPKPSKRRASKDDDEREESKPAAKPARSKPKAKRG